MLAEFNHLLGGVVSEGNGWAALPGSWVRGGRLGKWDKFLIFLYGCVSAEHFPAYSVHWSNPSQVGNRAVTAIK